MPFIILLLLTLAASARPDLASVREGLGSEDYRERETITRQLWEQGIGAVSLLEILAGDEDPEVARRAASILRMVRLGLGPGSPEDLLALAEGADRAPFPERSRQLGALMEHEEGFASALFFLNQWLCDVGSPHDHRVALSENFVERLLEQRTRWRDFARFPLSARSRAYLIAALGIQDSPHKAPLTAILASTDLREIQKILHQQFAALPEGTHLLLARLAVMRHDLALATSILTRGLRDAPTPELARALAFLEAAARLPPTPYEGNWTKELQLLRTRARRGPDAIIARARHLGNQPILQYESHLLAGNPALPESEDAELFAETEALSAWHLAFDHPPEEADIEALTSTLVIPWPLLARTLTGLAHPVEAAERLSGAGESDSAATLLWLTGRRERAIALASDLSQPPVDEDGVDLRLTLVRLALESGQDEQARRWCRPLLDLTFETDPRGRSAVSLARQLFPLDELVPMAPDLQNERAFRRRRAVAPFFDCPPQVAAFWYEKARSENPDLPVAGLIRKARELLSGDPAGARQVVAGEFARSSSRLLPSDPLYQQALYHRIPEAPAMVRKAAWYQLSSDDLIGIVQSDDWPQKVREQALRDALELDPVHPVLHWYEWQWHGRGDPATILWSTLGESELALSLARLTGTRETLTGMARVASFQRAATLRGLAILGRSFLDAEQPDTAARLLMASLSGEIALGTRPPTGIRDTLQNLEALYRARLQTAPEGEEAEQWRARLRQIGQRPPPASGADDRAPGSAPQEGAGLVD